MKILFINLPYYGHVMPTIGLVQELIKRGCEVTYLLPYDFEATIAESGATFYGYQNHKKLSEQIKNAYRTAENIIESFDFVIYEQFFFLGKHLAEKYNKPVARIFTAPVTNELLMKEFITVKGPLSIFKHKWIAKAFTKDIAKNISLKTDNWLDEIIYNPPQLNLAYTLRQYQPYAEEFNEEQFKFLGPSIYKIKSEEFDFVKEEKPVIYISLGTVVKGAVAFFQKFIEAFRDEPVDVIISVGKRFDTKNLKNVPQNIHIYNSVPQLEVLKISDVFVTHGGMNSVSEALVYGVPMVVIPFTADQPVNARCVEKLGVGQHLPNSAINDNTLKEYVWSVMTDAGIKENMVKAQELIKQAPGNAGGAEMIIKYYKGLGQK
ncbi:MAG: macrolide family glycosyltransferase [Acutalibacteraceae bacterium]|nr:macrolide family glycosyltransferase [Acutalibacteraceae bacterium]